MKKDSITIGELRVALTYKGRQPMETNWRSVFPGVPMPDDHENITCEQAREFVKSLLIPKRGRSAEITESAHRIYNSICGGDKMPNVPQPMTAQSMLYAPAEPAKQSKIIEFLSNLTLLDVVFFITLATAVYGLVYILGGVLGGAWGSVYALIMIHALQMAKNSHSQQTAKTGLSAVWILEIVSFFIHLAMFNSMLWKNRAMLPFQTGNRFDGVKWILDENGSLPFMIAAAFAALFSGAAIYAVTVTLNLTTEKTEAENYESRYNIKY